MVKKIKCNKVVDAIVIGGGPAGITAGIYLARRNLCVLVFYEKLGGQASLTSDIENYSGFRMISGQDFTDRMQEHIKNYDVTCKEEKIKKVEKYGEDFKVTTNKGEYMARSIIVASGSSHRKLKVPGEIEYLSKGVAYCATCDAPLFRDKDVAIVGGGNSALVTAIQLESYAKKIYLITINKKLKGEHILIDKVKSFNNVEIIPNSLTKEIKGDKFVEKIIIEDIVKKKTKEIPVKGVFVEIGYIPNSDFIDVEKNSKNEIIIDQNNQTSIKGIFAAGDVTNISVKQIIVAAGEGSKAAIAAAEYLSRKK